MLKYEKFDPPPVNSLSTTDLDRSPEMETLPQLDMELLPELHDVIYRKSSTLGHQPQIQPPQVNRQVRQKISYCIYFYICLHVHL